MGTDTKASIEWFNTETEEIESEETPVWAVVADGDFESRDGICISLGSDDNDKSVVVTEETLAALGYTRA